MSQLNYLEKLLDGVEVEWTTLGNEHAVEIANSGRKPVKAALRVAGETPYYGANNIQDYVDGYTHDGEFVLIAEDGSASLENYSIQYATGRFWANNHVHVVRGKEGLNTRYLYHYLCIVNFVPFLSGGGRAKLTKGKLVDIPLPIPCPNNPEKSLAIQAEIVRILDAFTAMTAELTAELNMRKKQYNYYRDQLLSFEDGEVEWKTLGEVATLRRGRVMSKGYLEENSGEYPVYSSQTAKNGMIGSIDTFDFDGEFISWTTDGANAGTVFYRTGKFSITNVCGLIKINDESKLIYKYLYYWLTIEAQKHVYSGMGNPKLMSHQVEKIPVPIPCSGNEERSLNKQQRIVAILDKLEALTFSITEGLPREIELRQKQYEYYRDLLLSFPKSEEAVA